MAIVISGSGINMGGNPVSNASQIDSTVMNENGLGVATETQVGTANSTLVKTALNASGAAPIYACRAWVNFNGTGTVAIRASGNVSSITDNGVGDYTVNFTTAMSDTNYSPVFGLSYVGSGSYNFINIHNSVEPTTISLRILTGSTSVQTDSSYASVAIFR